MKEVSITPLRRIQNEKGDIFHAIKQSEDSFEAFGEAYFTQINYGETKGWKKHTKMVMNLIVPIGEVQLFFRKEDETSFSVTIGEKNYSRVTVQPGVFMAFKGIGKGTNLMLNVASIEHDPEESINLNLLEMSFND